MNPNDMTMIMTKDLGRYLKKGVVVNLKGKMQSKSRIDRTETVAVYVDGLFLHFLSLSFFTGGYGLGGDKRESHALDITGLVASPGRITDSERAVIEMIYPGRFQ